MSRPDGRPVILLDVDNVLLDNDSIERDLSDYLVERFGERQRRQYWDLFEALRDELGYADYLGTLQRFRLAHPHDGNLVAMSSWLVDYPFADRLYPGALDVVRSLDRSGVTVILSDGDVVFQPRKIERSGIAEASGDRILIYIHKEQELDDVGRRYPADRYVLVDDKLRILSAVKEQWGGRVTTVFVRQGHYANDPDLVARYPAADVTLDRVDELSAEAVGLG